VHDARAAAADIPGRTRVDAREPSRPGGDSVKREPNAANAPSAPAASTASMGTERRFARFATDRSTSDGYWPLPEDGLCLSAFVLLSREDTRDRVLLGRIDPTAPWAHIGALDARRVRLNASGWMLPSCHLEYFEPPDDAARRVLREQLGLADVPLSSSVVTSECYRPRRHPERGLHWDLQFLYRGTAPRDWVPRHPAWTELRFLDPSATPRAEFTRSHEEVLELAGYRIG
jgi:ADP-ribose pyrophosphatase YjhB (NUDIX family)